MERRPRGSRHAAPATSDHGEESPDTASAAVLSKSSAKDGAGES
jgi:hypothetical protein